MGTWFKGNRAQTSPMSLGARVRALGSIFSDLRREIVTTIQAVNQKTSGEVRLAADALHRVVECARLYAREHELSLGRMQGGGTEGVGALLARRSELLRSHAEAMSARALEQDERARQAASTARSIAELAISIDRLAGETRLLAINARIESSRFGVRSSGFSVMGAEIKRLSDEVARTNDRVSELAGLLGQALPLIAQHARDVRRIMEEFSSTAGGYLEETERGVRELHERARVATNASASLIADILRASQNALSHLQFQDVVAQDLRRLDAQARHAQVDALTLFGASPSVLAEVQAAEYTTLGDDLEEETLPAPESGEVTLF